MANLNEAFSNYIEKQNKQFEPPSECPECSNRLLEYTDDGNKSCKCTKCGYYVWKHGDTIKNCYCMYCLNGDSESEYDLEDN